MPTNAAMFETGTGFARPGRLKRYGFAGAGVGCVGLAGVGAVVPGLPTTVFLIIASWCFARSCPWLTDKLIRNRFFGPFVKYLEPGAVMPARAKAISMAMMWAAIAGSSAWALWRGAPWFVPLFIASGGVVGSWFIVRQGRGAKKRAAAQGVRHDAGRRGSARPKCRVKTGAARV